MSEPDRPEQGAGDSSAVGRERAAARAAVLVVIAVLLPIQLWRASLGSTWWVDESESALLAQSPVARIVDYCSGDTNPPGYFVLLRAWMALGRSFLAEPGTLWIRLPGVLTWVVLLLWLWGMGRRLFGAPTAAAMAAAVAVSPLSQLFVEARAYGLCSAALTACMLLIWRLQGLARQGARPRRLGWLLYAALADLALWTHLLSAFVLGLLGLLWLASGLRQRREGAWLLRGWILAHLAAAVGFLPWLPHLPAQLAARRGEFTWWVTPASVGEWLRIFAFHYPVSALGAATPALVALGALTLLLPLAMLCWPSRAPARTGAVPAAGQVVAALGVPVAFVTLLWGLQRGAGISVFAGNRYSLLAAGPWAVGVALLAARAVARRGWHRGLVWVPLLPWAIAGLVGLAGDLQAATGPALERRMRAMMPPAGGDLFALPSRLAVFRGEELAPWRVRPVEELPCALRTADEAWVIDLSSLHQLELPNEVVSRAAVSLGVLAGSVADPGLRHPDNENLYVLRDIDRRSAAKLCADGWRPARRAIPPQAAAIATAENQFQADGWWWLEADRTLDLRRWWRRRQATAVFDRGVTPGDYILHFRGYCPAHESEPQTLRLRLVGTALDLSLAHRAGEVEVDAPVAIPLPLRRPTLVLDHALVSRFAPGMRRYPLAYLGAQLRYAWLERSARPAAAVAPP